MSVPRGARAGHRRRSLRRGLLAVVAALGLATGATAVTAPSAVASAPTPPSGWSQVFLDDFDGPAGSGVDTSVWQYDIGTSYPGGAANWGTGEIETMTSSTENVSLDGNGNLLITPRRDASGNWTSGRIETVRSDFQPPSGGTLRVEARIQMPNVTGAAAKGYWPAFWMLGSPFRGNYWNWPGIGELDIMENVQGLNTVWATMHCGTNPGGPCKETEGIGGSTACPGSTCQSGFHTYALEWDRSTSPEQMRFSVDGVTYHTVRADQMDATTWANATQHGYFLILNVAMGGGFPDAFGGGPDGGTEPGHPMVVDYVRVLQSGGGGGDTTPPPTGNRDAYSPIQAESYDAQSGVLTEATTDTDGGQNLGSLANGDWALYKGVTFGSTAATQFVARVASGAPTGVSGLVEVRLDDRNNPPIGSFAVGNTGGWQSWQTIPANISPVTGTHDVYLTFTSGQPSDFVNVNWFRFDH
ncbi:MULTISPECIES: glycoside hydrolase family 16 protein [Streptomyces]|uniref:Carbohydrate-binding protein n=1 Tax=Streptomyces thermoviolaceus subsp. thermoviolaceus TaxID=66860 RepID=A0ABX0YY44_STRTL|nr:MULTISPECIES: glycoside hydrolase family 16 protein [Streptomyces]MCM3266208.1 glycoside hydrolase family 16 protein [Streptomyces thermoviolaceus]NJP16942.1 carbohydrate-binding protein [Streptomyces thermoviolaceus subsp. thermoviolaceus]RSS03021.1 carbohydrate-binding protein [Streptomyces sp. WAC00469]WTD46568.1 glycoside hydrolase family 16 protein [Streptomyces thermoviolaceus]GGV82054.1 endo-1,3-beta-glucanase [Streptomyces thermoviolaceus subsp. apingens]